MVRVVSLTEGETLTSPRRSHRLKILTDLKAAVHVGFVYRAKIIEIVTSGSGQDYGALASLIGPTNPVSGIIPKSQISNETVFKVSDLLKVGKLVWVKCLEITKDSEISLSMKEVNQATGTLVEETVLPRPDLKRTRSEDFNAKAASGAGKITRCDIPKHIWCMKFIAILRNSFFLPHHSFCDIINT